MELCAEILKKYPIPDTKAIDKLLCEELKKNRSKVIVLDDDPTGVQTVHDIWVFTKWTEDVLEKGFRSEERLFYILTNSRAMTEQETRILHKEIGENIEKVSERTGIPYILISRSDSTLRGHYPLETETLRKTIESRGRIKFHGEILCPFFQEGGRFTIDDIHYVQMGDRLVPAAETEFARDKTFSYSSSDLKAYIQEKTGGKYEKEKICSISLEDLKTEDIDKIQEKLLGADDFSKIVVNATDHSHIKVFAVAVYRAIGKGKNYIFRSAAALVKEMGGIQDRPLLTREEMVKRDNGIGGIVIIGSHTEKTTRQMERLSHLKKVEMIPFDSDLVLEEKEFLREIDRTVEKISRTILAGRTAVVYTRRKLLSLPGETKEEALCRSVRISEGVQSLVGKLKTEPSFILAKGGITSSDIGTKALKVEAARVMGQICPGIPVWKTGAESRFPGIPYVIFPGNVGEEDTLEKAVKILTDK